MLAPASSVVATMLVVGPPPWSSTRKIQGPMRIMSPCWSGAGALGASWTPLSVVPCRLSRSVMSQVSARNANWAWRRETVSSRRRMSAIPARPRTVCLSGAISNVSIAGPATTERRRGLVLIAVVATGLLRDGGPPRRTWKDQ